MEDGQLTGSKRPSVDMDTLKRKKFKSDDLPLSAAQHAAIDKLLHSFKKKGGFDSIRKQIWAQFNDGVWPALSLLGTVTNTHPCRIPRPSLLIS